MNSIVSRFRARGRQFCTSLLTPVLFFLISFSVYGQDFTSITGKISDSSTGKPLPFASVLLLNTTLSNITNAEGVFTLKIPIQSTTDSLYINYLGYKGKCVSVSDFTGDKLKTISLEPSPINLQGVTVRPEDALVIFNGAFAPDRIKANYPQKTCGLTGFYREIIKKGNQYMSLSEAALDISKASYSSTLSDHVAIYKGRGSLNKKGVDTLFLQLQGGPLSSMHLDFAKYDFVGADVIVAQQYYNFWLGPSIYQNGKNIYTLHFNQKDTVADVLFRGKLYIESESLAIIRAEFSMNVEGKPNAWREFVKKKPENLNLGIERADYVINYKQYGSKWYYDYGRIELLFNARYKGKWLSSKYSIVSELAVTDIENEAALKIEGQKRLRLKDILSSKVKDFTDENFWENYNIIEPDESIENIINRIIRQLKRRDR